MLIYESFFQAIASLKQNKMRSILTMIGIIIGITAVIAIRMLGNSMSDAIKEDLNQFGFSNIYLGLVPKESDDSSEESGGGRGPMTIRDMTEDDYYTDEMIDDLKEHFSSEIKGVTYYSIPNESAKIVLGSEYALVQLFAVNADYMEYQTTMSMFQNGLIAGSKLSKRALDEGRAEIIISDKVCDNIFPKLSYDEVIGKEIDVPIYNDTPYIFHVKGVFETLPQYYDGEYDDVTMAYIPYNYVSKKFHKKGADMCEIIVNSDHVLDGESFSKKIQSYMDKYYHNNKYWGPSAYSLATFADEASDMIKNVSYVLMIVAGIALVVGGIGVMNIMFVSVSERTREIGIRKSLGATNTAIKLQFVIEAIVLSVLGGIIGILIGKGLGEMAARKALEIVNSDVTVPSRLDSLSVIIAVGFSVAIGVFFGYYPATKAAKLNPIDALRG